MWVKKKFPICLHSLKFLSFSLAISSVASSPFLALVVFLWRKPNSLTYIYIYVNSYSHPSFPSFLLFLPSFISPSPCFPFLPSFLPFSVLPSGGFARSVHRLSRGIWVGIQATTNVRYSPLDMYICVCVCVYVCVYIYMYNVYICIYWNANQSSQKTLDPGYTMRVLSIAGHVQHDFFFFRQGPCCRCHLRRAFWYPQERTPF